MLVVKRNGVSDVGLILLMPLLKRLSHALGLEPGWMVGGWGRHWRLYRGRAGRRVAPKALLEERSALMRWMIVGEGWYMTGLKGRTFG